MRVTHTVDDYKVLTDFQNVGDFRHEESFQLILTA